MIPRTYRRAHRDASFGMGIPVYAGDLCIILNDEYPDLRSQVWLGLDVHDELSHDGFVIWSDVFCIVIDASTDLRDDGCGRAFIVTQLGQHGWINVKYLKRLP